ncbi:WAT1-related protein [Vitis vinifera]|uniref:WAT1-related protein n=1 Tax=Vitis vinifera TaxID=29760 RepID=A0A438E7N1_VITVI|nr:WAT1-related protein [Vitis vinifera]
MIQYCFCCFTATWVTRLPEMVQPITQTDKLNSNKPRKTVIEGWIFMDIGSSTVPVNGIYASHRECRRRGVVGGGAHWCHGPPPHHHIELAHPWHQHCTNLDSVSTAILGTEFGYAGMNIITKVSLNRGMSHYVLVVYRHAFATAVIAPLLLSSKVRPKITLPIFLQLFVLGLLGPVIDQNFYYAGLKFTSPTFSCAMSNMLPAMTFVMAVLCSMGLH